jgi:ABC-type antimicrobial peptide transport system permease subunit
MYTLPPQPAAQIVNFQQMGGLPLTIALGVAIAAVLALALTIVASVRQRRRELALLKSLGMRRSQLRAVVLSQASTILVVAIVIGIPLGIAAGRWAWTAFASAIGVVPAPVVPTAALALGVLALLAAGNILATWPAAIAARTSAARTLRSE